MQDAAAQLMRGLIEAFLLESLAREPKHGYALLKELEEVFGDEPNRNRIYPLLSKLEDQGIVEGEKVQGSSRGKTRYSLTDDGHARLRAYKRMPPEFREAIHEMWGGATAADATAPAAGGAPVVAEESAPTSTAAGGDDGPAGASEATGHAGGDGTPQPPPDGERPYPCPDARLNLSKDPRTGRVEMQLTGCPMGAYTYCPQCPVYHSVQGLRKLLFG